MRVVVADDMGPPRRWLSRVVTSAGHEVVGEADDGRSALDLCKLLKPDLLVTDNAMPKLTGSQVAEIILREQIVRHVIVVTTTTQVAVEKQLQRIGCVVVPKTDDDTFLLRAIEGLHV